MQTRFTDQQLADPKTAHSEQILRQCHVIGRCGLQTNLATKPGLIIRSEDFGESGQRFLRNLNSLVLIIIQQRQQRLSEIAEIPLADIGLVAIGIAPELVDR